MTGARDRREDVIAQHLALFMTVCDPSKSEADGTNGACSLGSTVWYDLLAFRWWTLWLARWHVITKMKNVMMKWLVACTMSIWGCERKLELDLLIGSMQPQWNSLLRYSYSILSLVLVRGVVEYPYVDRTAAKRRRWRKVADGTGRESALARACGL